MGKGHRALRDHLRFTVRNLKREQPTRFVCFTPTDRLLSQKAKRKGIWGSCGFIKEYYYYRATGELGVTRSELKTDQQKYTTEEKL